MSKVSEVTRPERSLLNELCALASDEQRRVYLHEHPELVAPESVEWLAEAVRQGVRVDVTKSLRAGDAAILIAQALGDRACLARAFRAKGNALWFHGECRPASGLMAQAIQMFEDLALDDELGRTLSTSIQPLILLGEYDRALRNAEQAREIFSRHQNGLRLARLDINVANIYHRQGQYAEALAVYQRACRDLLAHRDAEATGVALHNIAVCLIGLDDFEHALRAYHEARQLIESSQMPLLLAQADYNIAHLYHMRGYYEHALRAFSSTHEIAIQAGDGYHAALCDLDQSEIYLDLNMVAEAVERAERAREKFERLGMRYEMARALTNLAIARSRAHRAQEAIRLFEQARAAFAAESHKVGTALIDLYQAILLEDIGEPGASLQFAIQGRRVFQSLRLRRKALICELLACRAALSLGDLDGARDYCQDALRQLLDIEAPILAHRAHLLSGMIFDEVDQRDAARAEYEAARRQLETVRGSLQREELKIAFMTNKLEVYERLILLCLRCGAEGKPAEDAFEYMEHAKCRALVDAMLGRAWRNAGPSDGGQGQERIEKLKAQLHWYYHRIEIEELQKGEASADRVDRLTKQARQCEDSLASEMRGLPYGDVRTGTLEPAVVHLEEIRAALAPESVLLEFCQTGNRLLAAVLNRDGVHLIPLALVASVKEQMRLLQFQLSRFRLGPFYHTASEPVALEATMLHLKSLYSDLVAPLRHLLDGRHLVVVPGGFLHPLPFHALHDGKSFLIDRYTVSYAPSASIYALCQRRGSERIGPSLIFGIHDSKAPWILSEVEEVAQAVPDASLFVGADATREVLERLGAQCRVIHIATHGRFRADNPMFSSVRLGDSHLSVYDLYGLNLPAELLTLSGCRSGINMTAAGDELIGLTRGLLYAGAQSLLLSLWDVHDRSTADFMRVFYGCWGSGAPKAAALQTAMHEVRKSFPHPYYWASFILAGKAF